jgi:hypothetical protein
LFFDLSKAFGNVKRPLIWRILRERANSDEEKRIVHLIIKMLSSRTIKVGESKKLY